VPACYDETCHNIDCPVCDPQGLGVLAKEVPFSHHANSTIVCRITGKIMNEDNPPLAFSNGNVYSAEVRPFQGNTKLVLTSMISIFFLGNARNGKEPQRACHLPSKWDAAATRHTSQGFRVMIYSSLLIYLGNLLIYISCIRNIACIFSNRCITRPLLLLCMKGSWLHMMTSPVGSAT
jgi:hypothetical protein